MNNKTTPARKEEVQRNWHLIDAKDEVLGRLSTQISRLLIGKDKVGFAPNIDQGDFVVVINAKDIAVTGNKEETKVYYRHSGYPGGLREEVLGDLRQRRPEEIIRHSVSGMLPKNKLRSDRLARLKIYANSEHPHNQVGGNNG